MPKYCLKCQKEIKEHNPKEHWAMIVTKKGQKIVDFQCFHKRCWVELLKHDNP